MNCWFPEDVSRALAAARHSIRASSAARTSRPTPDEAAWLAGYEAALDTLAVAFGLAEGPAGDQGEVITLPKAYYRVVEGG